MLFDAVGCFVHQVFGGETTTFQGTPGRTEHWHTGDYLSDFDLSKEPVGAKGLSIKDRWVSPESARP
jgi:hypothetical protein